MGVRVRANAGPVGCSAGLLPVLGVLAICVVIGLIVQVIGFIVHHPLVLVPLALVVAVVIGPLIYAKRHGGTNDNA